MPDHWDDVGAGLTLADPRNQVVGIFDLERLEQIDLGAAAEFLVVLLLDRSLDSFSIILVELERFLVMLDLERVDRGGFSASSRPWNCSRRLGAAFLGLLDAAP